MLAKVGECIYCGSRDDALNDEHIVPFGLSGPWVLERASCAKCARITSTFERSVLKDTLMVARATMGLATRRPNQRPTHFSLSITRFGHRNELRVPVSELTGTAIMLVLETPAYLDGRPYDRGVIVKGVLELHVGGLHIEDMAKVMGAEAVQTSATFHGNDFERMLAKIGYGFAIAAYGVEGFEEVYVLQSILGKTDDVGMWVGCPTDYLAEVSSNLHEAQVGTSGRDVHVRVRPFASCRGPWYQIVVGRLRDGYIPKS
jgi:hypothetical protein